jgi:hypothetical protein
MKLVIGAGRFPESRVRSVTVIDGLRSRRLAPTPQYAPPRPGHPQVQAKALAGIPEGITDEHAGPALQHKENANRLVGTSRDV